MRMAMGRRRAVRLGVVAMTIVALTAACGGMPSNPTPPQGDDTGYESVLAAIDGLTGDERRQRLIELAKEEGGVVTLYTSLNPDAGGTQIWKAFEDATGVRVEPYRASDEDVRARLLEESRAGRVSADVYETGGGSTVQIIANEGALFDYESPEVANLMEGSDKKGWTATRLQVYALEWNTDLIAEGEQPTSWQDLADPRYRGLLALDSQEYLLMAGLYQYWVQGGEMTEEEFDALWEGIADNATFVSTGHTATQDFVNAGENPMYIQFLYNVLIAVASGAPVAYQPMLDPVIATQGGGGPVRNAPHPAAALLYIDWLLSDGQEALAEQHYVPVRVDLLDEELRDRLVLADLEDYAANAEAYRERYDRLVERRY